jgi:hypothetical protein
MVVRIHQWHPQLEVFQAVVFLKVIPVVLVVVEVLVVVLVVVVLLVLVHLVFVHLDKVSLLTGVAVLEQHRFLKAVTFLHSCNKYGITLCQS